MSDDGQSALGDFADGSDNGRPADEAAAVAGTETAEATVVDIDERQFPSVEETVEFTVTQVDYTIEGRGDDEFPVVHLFGRTADDEAIHARVYEFKPYFYAPVDSVSTDRLREYDAITGWEDTDANGEPYTSIRDEQLRKIFGRTPRDVGQIRDEFDHYEADILFPNRLLIDKDITSGVRVPARTLDDDSLKVHHEEVEPVEASARPRVNTFDIEVDDRSGFPEDGEEPIICLTSHDSYDDEYIVWLYESPDGVDGPDTLSNYEPIREDFEADVRVFGEEEAMLAAFIEYIEDTDPDVLTGWNFEDFDAPYLLDRLEALQGYDHDYNLDINRLSRVDEVWRSGWGGPDIKGRVVFDLLYAYKRTQFTELDSYRLDAVGEEELDVGKERYAGDIGDLWEQDPERLLEYNLRDVELCVELDREQDIIDFWDEVRTFVGCKLEDAPTPGDAVDMYVLHKLHGEYALPSKGQQESEEYEGGAVFDPITGVRENVSVLDLKCFSGDTEVMTPDGPVNIKNLDSGDDVYTLDPDSFECEIQPVTETHQYENTYGELHHLSGNTHDLKITENHRLLYSKERGWDEQEPEDFEFDEYRDIPEYERFAFPQHESMDGRSPETFELLPEVDGGNVVVYTESDLRVFRNAVPQAVRDSLDLVHGSSAAMGIQKSVGKYLIPLPVYKEHQRVIDEHADDVFLKYGPKHRETLCQFEMDDWLEFLGWFVTEGSTDRANGCVTLHQSDDTGREAIQALLDRMGINYNTDEQGVNISNQYLLDWLADNCGEGYENKRLPDWVFDLDGELLSVLLNTMIRGDGSRTESGLGKFWTKSPHLRDAVADIAVRCGHKPTVSEQKDGTYYVSVGKRGSFKKETNAEVEPHDGDVFCITARDNHVVLAGRNGNFQWVGQSLYPMCMVTTNASPETKVDPEQYDGDTYQSPNGTHFRKEPDGVIREMVDELLTEREQKKEQRNSYDPNSPEYERLDRQQASVKIIMNSLYGVLGWDRFRLYDKEMGAAVTATGREVIDYTDEVVENEGYEVVYGDSVTGDRPVVVRDPDGQVRIEPIADLFERADTAATERAVVAGDGGTTADSDTTKDRVPLSGWDALSISDSGETEWREITQVIRHETNKDIVTLQHKFGESTTTRDHSYVVEEDGELVEQPPDAVSEPLRVDGLPALDTVETVDVYEVLNGYTRTYEDGRMVGSENASEKTKRVHADSEWVWFGHSHHDSIDKYPKLKRYIELDSEDGRALVRLLAAYISEGSASTAETTDSRYGASISESRHEWLEQLQTDYHRLFADTTASIIDSDHSDERTVEYETTDGTTATSYDDGTKKSQMMNELAAVFFRECAGQTSCGKRLPSFVFHLPDGLQSLFLDVLVEGDGSREFPRYSEEYSARNFDFETTSRELAAGLSMLLTQREKKHSLKYRDEKDSYTIRTCEYYRSSRDPVITETDHDGYVYDLSVKENENFVDAVGGIVLHNTDSVMLQLGDVGPDDVEGDIEVTDSMREKHPEMDEAELETIAATIQKGFELEDVINSSYDEFALEELNAQAHRFEIEFEKLYRRFFQAGKKKRYAGHIVWKEGKDVDDIDITGFEYQRSDIAPITKRVQKEVIDRIVHGEDAESIKSYVGEVIEEYQAGNVEYDDVGIPGGIGKKLDNYDTDTAQVRGAKYANLLLGTNFGNGSKPKRLYLDRVHADFFERIEAEQGLDPAEDPLYGEFRRNPDVICFEYADQIPEEFEIDWDKMLDKTLKGPIARILEALDISWEEVKSGQEQTGLGQYM